MIRIFNGTIAAAVILAVILTGCDNATLTAPDSAASTADAFRTASTIANVSTGTLITGNVGSTWIAVFVNGNGYETIAPGNETARDLAPGFYRVTFEPSAEYIETANGQTIAGCVYPRLQIIAGKETAAYCSE